MTEKRNPPRDYTLEPRSDKLTLENWIDRFQKVHGELYGYELFRDAPDSKKSWVICRTHGKFLISKVNHSRGTGCYTCRGDSLREKSKEKRIKKLKALDTDKSWFVSLSEDQQNVTYQCPHGLFSIRVANARDYYKCPECSGESKKLKTGIKLFPKIKAAFGGFYDTSAVKYIDANSKIEIICKTHGSFWVLPGNYYTEKSGCPGCRDGRPSKEESLWIDELERILQQKAIRQVPLTEGATNTWMIDAVFGNVAIEYDGAYWHSLPKMTQRDGFKNRLLKENGYWIIRLRAEDSRLALPTVHGSKNFSVPKVPTETLLKEIAEYISLKQQDTTRISTNHKNRRK